MGGDDEIPGTITRANQHSTKKKYASSTNVCVSDDRTKLYKNIRLVYPKSKIEK